MLNLDKENEILMKLNFNVGTKGYRYWLYAINNENINKEIMTLYLELAVKENTSWQNIQGSMNLARKNCDQIIRNYFNYYGKLNNKIIINLIKLRRE